MPKQVRALRAKTTIAFSGSRRFIYEGDLVRSDDPAVKSHPEAFELVDEALGIEQATKQPGQKRAARKPAPKPDEVADGVDGQAAVDAPSSAS
jgi:hypothetical protein